ncbi:MULTISPECIES: DUF1772 domain-containing protein [unclassified Corallococcus]|uniref:DUF1772 domain-containing protein n=1 Tax=unclassified Corallococcus TaxID=2685029 RepID=UPI001A8C6543|nr:MULTISPECIES: DUF1772 domain-containing protein [unclassified Corallococcus]MBN9682633.1 DUF1772 domain-containing protein [Corallococcus sp. NCSPR001]WAS85822.1 DUF1772 domain-containing protein [Corallococcus sp. NCRR]
MMNLKPSGAEILLWLFVLNLGVAFGAGLYEHRISLPRWLDVTGAHWSAEAARQDDVGRRFWGVVTTAPLTLLTLASLYFATRATGPLRSWWLAAVGVVLVDRLLTFSYFIPTMVRLMQSQDTPVAVETAMRWSRMNHLRHALTGGAWVAALQALSWLRVKGAG